MREMRIENRAATTLSEKLVGEVEVRSREWDRRGSEDEDEVEK